MYSTNNEYVEAQLAFRKPDGNGTEMRWELRSVTEMLLRDPRPQLRCPDCKTLKVNLHKASENMPDHFEHGAGYANENCSHSYKWRSK